ncbi:hypothetical protein COK86_10145 [Bacillus cereus]|uniref:PBSX phage terminase small subunit-like N-terminal domain-containing protein n=1 Tax=Bacillus cereus TaxID=1396 RepID=A0A2B3U4F4_BACCE|nr:hypothetical protein COK86_10145 [Bacillus cereus]
MARQRSPDRDRAFEIYKASKGEKIWTGHKTSSEYDNK